MMKVYSRRELMMETGKPKYITDGLVFWLDGLDKGASNGTWVEKIHGTVFSGNATSVDKGFDFRNSQRMSGSWVNGTGNNFTVEVCYYTATTGKHFVWGVGTQGTKTPLYYDNAGAITTIQDLNTFKRPTTIVPNKTVSINQDRGIYNGISISKNNGIDYWLATPNATTAYIGKGHSGGASTFPLTGTVYAIRVYNRKLSANEMLNNQRIDNKRFNLGLNI
jgi:hypothetical protein